MKACPRLALAIAAALAVLPAFAQEEDAAAPPGLAAPERTPEERVAFLLEVARAYFSEKDYESAIGAYERILDIDPQHQEARYIIAHVYIQAHRYGKAQALLKRLIEEHPEDFKLLNNLAWLYATAEDPAFRDGYQAIDLAHKAMVLAPNDHHVWSTLAEGYYVTGQYEKAFRAITHMAQLASRYGKGITKEAVEGYNEQIRKCKRAMDLQEALEEAEEE